MATTTTTTDTPKITHESIVRAMEMFEFPKTKTKGAAVAHHMTALIASWLNAGRISELELSSKDGKKISLPNVISGFVQKLKAAENE